MNERALAEIIGVLMDDITILVELDGSLFGLIRLEVEDSDIYFKTNCIDVYLYGNELLAIFIPLLKKGSKVNLIGEMESTQTTLLGQDSFINLVIKITDKKRINIIPNEPNRGKSKEKIDGINFLNNPQTTVQRCSSNNGLKNNIWI